MNKTINLKDEIFDLNAEFNSDTRIEKINCGIGIYLDNLSKPFVIPIVKKIASSLDFSNFNYLPISGDPIFLEESSKLIFGDNLYDEFKNELVKQGVAGGTNGLFVWGSLIKLDHQKPKIIIGNPTWENHKKIFNNLGFNIIEYEHLDKNNKFNLNAFEKNIKKYPQNFVLFHGGPTHNPTGVNPSQEEWLLITKLIKETKSQVCFDSAYLGLGDSIENDSFAIRHFLKQKIPTSIIISYSKNMSLYQHRTGILIMNTNNKKNKDELELKIKYIFRIINSNPPAFGELIVKNILQNKEYKNEWLESLKEIRNNLQNRRNLFNKLTKNNFKQVIDQKGLFSLLNLNKDQISVLKRDYGIYLLSNSRINFGGLNEEKIINITKAINSLKNHKN